MVNFVKFISSNYGLYSIRNKKSVDSRGVMRREREEEREKKDSNRLDLIRCAVYFVL